MKLGKRKRNARRSQLVSRRRKPRKVPAPKQANKKSLAPVHVGNNYYLGFVNKVNGAGSVTTNFPVSCHEALVLVRYWLEEYIDCKEWQGIQYSSSEARIMTHAQRRIGELRDVGLVTQQQINQIADAIYAAADREK